MTIFQPWQLLVVSVAGWINRHQQDVIAYIQEENRILKHKLKGKRIRFTDDEPLGDQGQGSWPQGAPGSGVDCDAGHDPGLASQADRQEMGPQLEARAGTPACDDRYREADG